MLLEEIIQFLIQPVLVRFGIEALPFGEDFGLKMLEELIDVRIRTAAAFVHEISRTGCGLPVIKFLIVWIVENLRIGDHLGGVEAEQVTKFVDEGAGKVGEILAVLNIHLQDPIVRIIRLLHRTQRVAGAIRENGKTGYHRALVGRDDIGEKTP